MSFRTVEKLRATFSRAVSYTHLGEAEAMRLRNQELTENILLWEYINKWDGKMPTYYGGDSGTMIGLPPLEGNTDTSSQTQE